MLLCLGTGWRGAGAQSFLMNEEFNGTAIDASRWDVHDNGWFIGRTRFGNAPQLMTENGTTFARLTLDSFNVQQPGVAFRGTELWSREQWPLQNGVEWTARLRGRNLPPGIVFSFFTYRQRNFSNDFDQEEIDFEFLSRRPSNQVWLNIWKGVGSDSSSEPTLANFDYNNWNIYKIRWLYDRVEWLINDVVVRTDQGTRLDDRMSVCFNIWAAGPDWPQAYDSSLQPATTSSQSTTYAYDVDYVRVNRPAAPAGAVIGSGRGLAGVFFDNQDWTNSRAAQLAPVLNFNWEASSPQPGIGAESWSARWTGQIEAQFSENYTFYTSSDDGVRLWINNQLLIDRATLGNGSANFAMVAGHKYDIKVDYFDEVGDASLRLRWSSPSTPIQLVPPTQLYPSTPEALFPPQISVSTPIHTFSYTSLPQLRGSAGDSSMTGLQSVTATLKRDSDNRYWDGNSWEIAATALPATGKEDWWLNLPPLADGKYFVQAKATDNSGLYNESGVVEFFLDTTAPTVVITTPQANVRAITEANGTCIDAGPGVAEVQVRLSRLSDGYFWNGSAWQTASVALTATLNAERTSWSYGLPTLPDGRYRLQVTASDWVGNLSQQVTREFRVDTIAPALVVTTPTANGYHGNLEGRTARVNGTVFDAASGVNDVVVRIFSTTTSQSWTVNTTGANSPPPIGSTVPQWVGFLPDLAEGLYRLQATARDLAGNENIVTFDFYFDKTPPLINVAQPQNGAIYPALSEINGTAQDAGAGVQRVVVAISRNGGLWWNGTTWVSDTTVVQLPAQGTTSWKLPINATWPSGTYQCSVFAADNVDNASRQTINFSIDAQPPTIALEGPAFSTALNGRITNNPQAWGTASDGAGLVQAVRARVQRTTDNLFWNGNSWVPQPTILTAAGTSNWVLPLPHADGIYNLEVWSVDSGGNSPTPLRENILVDVSAPTVAVQLPGNGAIRSTLNEIAGNSADNLSGVQFVRFSLQRLSDGRRWNGTQWSDELPGVLDVSPGQPQTTYAWSKNQGLPDGDLTPGEYEIVASATDVVGNSATSSPVRFSIALPTPTPTVEPTATPTVEPTITPTPTEEPTATPTPTEEPTATPTEQPTATPTEEPTATPTEVPTATPTATPSPDRTAPLVLWTAPKNLAVVNRLTALAGVVVDNVGGSGVARVEVVLQRNSDRRFWNGRGWGTTAVRVPARFSGRNWVLLQSTLSGANLPGGMYTMSALATDFRGNRATSTLTVRVDVTGPVIMVLSPRGTADPRVLPAPITDLTGISGRAVDADSTQRVQLMLQRTTDNQFWSGTRWQTTAAFFPAVVTGTSWARNSSLPRGTLLPNGLYRLTVNAYDRLGNRGVASWRFVIRRTTATSASVNVATAPMISTSSRGTSPLHFNILLSAAKVDVPNRQISLQFASPLDASSATEAGNYRVILNGIEVEVEMVKLDSSTRVRLALSEDDWQSGPLTVQWANLRDGAGRIVNADQWSGQIP